MHMLTPDPVQLWQVESQGMQVAGVVLGKKPVWQAQLLIGPAVSAALAQHWVQPEAPPTMHCAQVEAQRAQLWAEGLG